MKGKYFKMKDRGLYAVSWYCTINKRGYTITRYTQTWDLLSTPELADKQLKLMQNDWESHKQGRIKWRIEKYTKKGATEVVEFYNEWLNKIREDKMAPATIKGYESYLRCHIQPYFLKNPKRLHEIDLVTLNALRASLLNVKTQEPLEGKGKLNVMMAMNSMMTYALEADRIPSMPPFPKVKSYNLRGPDFSWLQEADQMKVIEAIETKHRPIFLFLKYHYRRPSEACALFKTDYNMINNEFVIRRSFSARTLVDSTKTKAIHHVPCDDEFTAIARRLVGENLNSKFLFINPRARSSGKHYTNESLNIIWDHACEKVGIDPIGLYEGTKHSSCTQFINEKGGHDAELQMLTDHASIASVSKYRKIGTERKRELMRKGRKIVEFPNLKDGSGAS